MPAQQCNDHRNAESGRAKPARWLRRQREIRADAAAEQDGRPKRPASSLGNEIVQQRSAACGDGTIEPLQPSRSRTANRKSGVQGKSVAVRVEFGGRRLNKKKKQP